MFLVSDGDGGVIEEVDYSKIAKLAGISMGNESDLVSEICKEQLKIILREKLRTGEQLPPAVLVLLCIPAVIIILLTIFGNLLVLFFKARVGRTNTTLLVWNLGLTDFLVGVIVLPMGAVYLIYRKWIFGRFLCRLWVAADVTFCTCSVVSLSNFHLELQFHRFR